jgi:hypothetical protein
MPERASFRQRCVGGISESIPVVASSRCTAGTPCKKPLWTAPVSGVFASAESVPEFTWRRRASRRGVVERARHPAWHELELEQRGLADQPMARARSVSPESHRDPVLALDLINGRRRRTDRCGC